MANEHSIRVSARGEFGQLERGLKNLQKDLSGVLGEIDKGARKGGFFDETQLRALDVFRGRFKSTMDELNREFEKQNSAIEELYRKQGTASGKAQKEIDKEIRGREKQLDVIRKQIIATEDLYRKRNKEATGFGSMAPAIPTGIPGGGGMASKGGMAGGGLAGGLLGGGIGKMLGAGKFVAGLAGLTGIASMAQQAYQLAYQSQVQPLNLSQRIRGQGYGGSAKGMWDTVGGVGRNDSMGYTSDESWSFLDQYSRQAGSLNTYGLEDALKFSRGYGLETGESAGALGSMRQMGGVESASQFADMIAESVGKSGMTPRILEVMQTSNGLLASMNTSLKDTGAKQILAYQTTLDTIGQEKGMMKLTGQEGANIIGGLGGIYNPSQGNDWKYMGMQALQEYDPKKYGKMGLYDLEASFEDGLMNADNIPAMGKYMREASGGNEDTMKRMLQKWLQDGGYNATKTQVNELYDATDGMTAFDSKKIEALMADLDKGDGTAKYQERMGQTGQRILDVNSRFEKQMENLGQPLLNIVTDMKEGLTDILEELTDGGKLEKIVEDIYDFMKEHWKEIATAGAIGGLSKLIASRLPNRSTGDDDDDRKKGKENKPKPANGRASDGRDGSDGHDGSNGSKVPLIFGGAKALGKGGLLALLLGGATVGKQGFDVFGSGNKEKHQKWAKEAGLDPNDISITDRFFAELADILPGVDPKDFYSLFSKESATKMKGNMETFFRELFPSFNVPKTKEEKQHLENFAKDENKDLSWYQYANPENWGKIELPEGWDKPLKEMKEGFFSGLIDPVNEALGWDIGGEKKQQAIDSLVNLGTTGNININGLSEHGKTKLQELADKGLIELTKGKDATVTQLSGFNEKGKESLKKLASEGLISIGGFTTDGKAKITVMSDEGQKKLNELKKNGSIDIGDFKTEGTKNIKSLSKTGAEELIDLQKNGSLSLDGMNETTDEKLEKVRKLTSTKLDDVKGEHKKWSDKLIGKDGIFTKFADGALKVFEDMSSWWKENMPSWLGGGDSDIGYFEGGGGKPITKEAEAYRGKVSAMGKKYGIDDTNLLMAMLNQESKGRGNDVFQSSESLGLPRNSLGKDASIKQGVKYFSEMLEKSGGDVEMALSAYNFGSGYIPYAKKHGGHSAKTAKAYSNKMGGSYGDPNYVKNVLQYYPGMEGGGGNFFKGWESRVTSRFGSQEGFRSKPHGGLDINGEQGDHVQALKGGKISFIKMDDGGKYDSDGKKNTRGGGTEVGIKMANGQTYFYSHLSKVSQTLLDEYFKKGNKNINIQAGQYIGNVGGDRGKPGSGSSTTGSHLHIGMLSKQGYYKDPESLLRSLGAGDSDIGQWQTNESIATKNINVNVTLGGEVEKLNGKTESQLKKLITQVVKDYNAQQMLLNPSARG